MLRPRTVAEIQATITESRYFKTADFSFDSKDSGSGTTLSIGYQYNPKYFLSVAVPLSKTELDRSWAKSKAFVITGRVSPGELSDEEPVEFTGLQGLRTGISEWLKRLQNELQMAPVVRQVAEQEQLLDDLLQQVKGLPDEYFSKDEAQDIVRRLEELESRLSDNLSQNLGEKEQLNCQIQAIVTDIQMLKDNLGSLKKPGWAKALMVRAAEWMKVPANRQLLSSGAEVARELLLEAGKHSTTSGQ